MYKSKTLKSLVYEGERESVRGGVSREHRRGAGTKRGKKKVRVGGGGALMA